MSKRNSLHYQPKPGKKKLHKILEPKQTHGTKLTPDGRHGAQFYRALPHWVAIRSGARVDEGARTCRVRVANSTPMVDLESRAKLFLVKRESRLDFPTPESPMSITLKK